MNITQDQLVKRKRGGSKKGQSKNVGSKHGNALLTEKDVFNIHALLYDGVLTYGDIGNIFNVTSDAIRKIKKGENWKHVYQLFNFIVKHDYLLHIILNSASNLLNNPDKQD